MRERTKVIKKKETTKIVIEKKKGTKRGKE